jgi:hypothetical protein
MCIVDSVLFACAGSATPLAAVFEHHDPAADGALPREVAKARIEMLLQKSLPWQTPHVERSALGTDHVVHSASLR